MRRFILCMAALVASCIVQAKPEDREVRHDVPLDSILLSDPAILADQKTKMYYMTGTGGMMWRSNDLSHLFASQPSDTRRNILARYRRQALYGLLRRMAPELERNHREDRAEARLQRHSWLSKDSLPCKRFTLEQRARRTGGSDLEQSDRRPLALPYGYRPAGYALDVVGVWCLYPRCCLFGKRHARRPLDSGIRTYHTS